MKSLKTQKGKGVRLCSFCLSQRETRWERESVFSTTVRLSGESTKSAEKRNREERRSM